MIHDLLPYPDYKESGLPWLGKTPVHWEVRRTKYVFREVDRRSTNGEETQLSMSQMHGLVESSKIDTWRMRSESYVGGKLCEAGDLVLNRLKAHLGVFAHARMAGVISPDYSVFRPKTDADSRYFESVLKTPLCVAEIRRFTKGIVEGFWRLYTDDFYNLTVPFPPSDEQAAIVRFLDHADRRIRRYIRAKRQLIALLNDQKQAIIHRAVTRGLDPNIRLKPSGVEWLGDVPEHWQRARLKNVAVVQTGVTLGKRYGQIALQARPYLRVANVQTGYLDLETVKTVEVPKSEIAGSELQAGDVLMTEGGDIDKLGRGCVWRGEIEGCLHQNHIFAVRPNQSRLLPDFLVALMASRHGRCYFEITAKRTTNLASTNSTTLGAFPLYLPDVQEQCEILEALASETSSTDAAINRAEREIVLLREYRSRLIADIVTGKLDVREAAERLPEDVEEIGGATDDLLEGEDVVDDTAVDAKPEEVEA